MYPYLAASLQILTIPIASYPVHDLFCTIPATRSSELWLTASHDVEYSTFGGQSIFEILDIWVLQKERPS